MTSLLECLVVFAAGLLGLFIVAVWTWSTETGVPPEKILLSMFKGRRQ